MEVQLAMQKFRKDLEILRKLTNISESQTQWNFQVKDKQR